MLKDGEAVKISERIRLASFGLDVEVTAAVWCLEILQDFTEEFLNKKLFKNFIGANFVILFEKYENKRGRFVRISKLSNGNI